MPIEQCLLNDIGRIDFGPLQRSQVRAGKQRQVLAKIFRSWIVMGSCWNDLSFPCLWCRRLIVSYYLTEHAVSPPFVCVQ